MLAFGRSQAPEGPARLSFRGRCWTLELAGRQHREEVFVWEPQMEGHLSLMPFSLEDVEFVQRDHKAGLMRMLSRGGGRCFIKGMALDGKERCRDLWFTKTKLFWPLSTWLVHFILNQYQEQLSPVKC